MKIVKFLAKCILASLPLLAVVIFAAANPMCYMDEEYPAWRYTMDTVDNAGCGADVLILGDSRAMADLIPEVISGELLGDESAAIENLAVGGATTIEMYCFLERYLEHNEAPETAVVMFAPFHYSYIDNYKTRTTYFNALTLPQLIRLLKDAKEAELENSAASYAPADLSASYCAVKFEDYIPYTISARLFMPDVYLPAMLNARLIGRKSLNTAAYDNLRASHGQGYFGTLDGCSDAAYEASYTQMSEDDNAYLLKSYADRLLKLLYDNGVKVILAQPPMNETTYDSLDANYVNQYRDYITTLCEAYDNVIFEDMPQRYDNEYFGDASHLNEKGAVKFSKEFAEKYAGIL